MVYLKKINCLIVTDTNRYYTSGSLKHEAGLPIAEWKNKAIQIFCINIQLTKSQ